MAIPQCRLQPCGHQPRTEATRRTAKSWMPGVAANSWAQTLKARRKVQEGRSELASLKPSGGFNLPRRPALGPRAPPPSSTESCTFVTVKQISTSRKASKNRGNVFKTIYSNDSSCLVPNLSYHNGNGPHVAWQASKVLKGFRRTD